MKRLLGKTGAIALLVVLTTWPLLLLAAFMGISTFSPSSCRNGVLDWLPACVSVTGFVYELLSPLYMISYFAVWYYQVSLVLWVLTVMLALAIRKPLLRWIEPPT